MEHGHAVTCLGLRVAPQVHDGRYWVVCVSSLGFPATNDRLCGDGIPPSRRQVVCGGHDLARV
jgi:hypothetical protein